MNANSSDRSSSSITELLGQWQGGDAQALDQVFGELYALLKNKARVQLLNEPANHTLQPTALVNELYLRLKSQHDLTFSSEQNFLAFAGRNLRRLLIDHARAKRAAKRGGPVQQRVDLDHQASAEIDEAGVDLLALDQALEELGESFPRHVQVVELRYFAGFTLEETAEALGVAVSTVRRDWNFARAWLHQALHG